MAISNYTNLSKNHALLAKLFMNSLEGMMLVDQKMQVIFLNSSATALIGYILSNQHFNLLSICAKESAQQLQSTLDEVYAAPAQAKKVKLQILHLSGHEVSIDCTLINLLQDEDVQAITVHFAAAKAVEAVKTLAEDQLYKMVWFESVVTNIKDAVVITEVSYNPPSSKIIYVNAAFTAMTGYTLSEVIGKSPRFLQGPNTAQSEIDRLSECMSRWESCEITIVNYKKNGEEFWVDLSISPMADHQGNYTHWIAIERDVTAQKELENLLQSATHLAGIGGWDYDYVHDKISCSTVTRQIFEFNEEDEIPTIANLSNFFKDKDALNDCYQNLQKTMHDGEPFDFELEILTTKNNVRWVRVIGKAEFNGSACTRIRGSFQDIDARKRSELLALATMREKIEILESIGDAFFALDVNWNVTYWNGRAELLLHKTRAEILGQNLWDVYADTIETDFYEKYHWAVNNQQEVHFEAFYEALQTWYEISAYPSANGLSVYFKDITQRKINEKEIIDSEKRYSDLFQLSPIPKWVFDMDTFKFLAVNRAAVKHYGYSLKEFLKMSIFDIRPEEEFDRTKNLIHKQNRGNRFTSKGLFTHKKKNGELIRVEIRSTTILFKGRPAKIVIADDVTEQEKYVLAIEKQNQKLKEVSWIQSHIFRAPLARIQGLVSIVESSANQAEQKWVLEKISSSADELDGIIKEITAKTKIDK
ncbi:PAS domain S-box protein [Pedobacter cryotolerans]|uniref:PAS domain S-box protein n=1 Tax=Pedobacter cryotolerans TaxID=2571270 RepID=A0A4U1CAG3_9SPHI|nr:PAS domain S-box protein [Pedobacter cryotolerans]TKC03459.1 PAS domain S-box protein [Pedobacter cryotolerans]